MHCFRLCDSVMLHKSNLRSYRRPSLRGFDCQFRHAFCFSYSICTRSVWMTSIQQDDRKEVTGGAQITVALLLIVALIAMQHWSLGSNTYFVLGITHLETCNM